MDKGKPISGNILTYCQKEDSPNSSRQEQDMVELKGQIRYLEACNTFLLVVSPISWINETYRWLWQDLLGMRHPFTYYFRLFSKKEPAGFWLPVSVLVFFTLLIVVALVVLLLGFVKPFCDEAKPLWQKILLFIGWALAFVWMLGGLGFLIWFCFHIGVGC
jgi:hypothetical protein